MDDQSQHLFGFGLELFDLWLGFGGHGLTIVMDGSIQRATPLRRWGHSLILQAGLTARLTATRLGDRN